MKSVELKSTDFKKADGLKDGVELAPKRRDRVAFRRQGPPVHGVGRLPRRIYPHTYALRRRDAMQVAGRADSPRRGAS